MHIDTDNLLESILENLSKMSHVKTEDIPNIELYMDQVTTFMDKELRGTARNPEEDKVLTKTMINNYAKNKLLPAPNKKKYSKDHILMLTFIYYFKGFLSISDIQSILDPLSERYFGKTEGKNLEEIYNQVFRMEKQQMEAIKEDIQQKFELAKKNAEGEKEEDAAFMELFSFIALLSFDVYIKKMLIEKMIDDFQEKKEEK